MGNKRRRALEWGKTGLIILLAISAAVLLNRSRIMTDRTGAAPQGLFEVLGGLFAPSDVQQSAVPTPVSGQHSGTAPVRLVLSGPLGRYGAQYDNAAVAEPFAAASNPLADALAAAGTPTKTSQREWRTALTESDAGVYLDFLGEVPLGSLSIWLSGGRNPVSTLTASTRRLLLVCSGENVALYYVDERSGQYYTCVVRADLSARLGSLVERYPPNNAAFAFENPKQYEQLDGNTLLLTDAPKPLQYRSANPAPLTSSSAVEAVAVAFGFHPQSYTSYGSQDEIVIQEGADKLRVGTKGTLTYRAGDAENQRYPIAQGDSGAVAAGAAAFAEKHVAPLLGAGKLYFLDEGEAVGGGTQVRFGYQLGGAQVRFGGGQAADLKDDCALRLVVRDGYVTEFSLRLRSYTAGTEVGIVLPEQQAAAAVEALGAGGAELLLCYTDTEDGALAAGWIAR